MNRTLDSRLFLNPVVLKSETGKNIAEYIARSNLKIKDLQNLLELEQPQAIYNWLSGKDLPKVDNLVKLAHFLDTTIDKLVAVDFRENQAECDVPEKFLYIR